MGSSIIHKTEVEVARGFADAEDGGDVEGDVEI